MNKIPSIFLLYIFQLVYPAVIYAQNNSSGASFTQSIPEAERKILKRYGIKKDSVSYSLIDIETKQVVYDYNQKQPFIPASITKILSMFFVLKTLSPKTIFHTELFMTGDIKEGILHGDLLLKGGGDPMLTNANLHNLVMALHEKGIKSVQGNFYYDDHFFMPDSTISNIGLGDQTYNPGVSALSLEFNRIEVYKNHKYTSRAEFVTIPPIETFKINKTKNRFTWGKRFNLVESTGEQEVWQVSNRLKYSRVEEIPVRNPALYTASTFRFMARNLGITIPTPKPSEKTSSYSLIKRVPSKDVLHLAKSVLEYSNNLLTEVLLLHAAQKASGKKLTIGQASKVMLEWFKKTYPKISWENTHMINGSGLTSKNRLSASTLSQILSEIYQDKLGDYYFWNLLSISGQSGWIERNFKGPELSFRIWAKTGSLDYVDNLAGYLITNKGKKLAFSLFINDLKKREIVDGLNSAKVERTRQRAGRWGRSSDQVINQLLVYWLNHY